MTRTRKYVIALAAVAAGSIMYGTLPAHAGGIELDRVEIEFRHHHEDRGRDMPPPPPPNEHRRHMPPPHNAGDRHDFGPRGPHGHMPPPPPHHGPRGHMPPPPPHRW